MKAEVKKYPYKEYRERARLYKKTVIPLSMVLVSLLLISLSFLLTVRENPQILGEHTQIQLYVYYVAVALFVLGFIGAAVFFISRRSPEERAVKEGVINAVLEALDQSPLNPQLTQEAGK